MANVIKPRLVTVICCRCDVRVQCKKGYLESLDWDIANNADPDQTPRHAASDQGLHCLLILQAVKG